MSDHATTCQFCESHRLRAEGIANDLALSEKEVTRQRRVIQALEQRLADVRADEEEGSPEVRRVLEHWVRALGKGANTNIRPGGSRAEFMRKVLRRKGYTLERVLKAIDGCALVPYVGPAGRQSTPVNGRRNGGRHDDLTLIFRDDETFERFEKYAEDRDLAVAVERIRACGVVEDRAWELMHLRSVVDSLEQWASRVWLLASPEERELALGEAWGEVVESRAAGRAVRPRMAVLEAA